MYIYIYEKMDCFSDKIQNKEPCVNAHGVIGDDQDV